MDDKLTWDDSYAIARQLMGKLPGVDLDLVSLAMVFQWTIALPDFCDDPELVNDDILKAIFLEWYEEKYTYER